MSGSPPAVDPRLRALLAASADAVLFTNAEGEVVEHNAGASRMFGVDADALIGASLDALVDEDGGLAAATNLSFRRADGSRFEAAVTCVDVAELDQRCWVLHDLDDRGRSERAMSELRDSNELLRALSDAAFEAVFMHSEGRIRKANRAAEIYAGVGPGELVGRQLVEFIAPQCLPEVMARVTANDDRPYEAFALRSDGTVYPVEVHARTTPVELGEGLLRVAAMRDMSERRELEAQLRQAQKLEAIGRVAAGVAHDFNNLLSLIATGTELAAMHLDAEHPSRAELDEILAAADRGAKLVRQLLAFGLKTALQPQVIDAVEVLEQMRSMLERLVGDAAELELSLPEHAALLRADPVQLEQVLVNLVVNARDAIVSDHGRVRVAIEVVDLDEGFARDHVDVEAGRHVKITISDTGMGMDAETLARVFEPFFTTKGPRGGTGLGLATVFGIVRQSGGTIWVESVPERGTTFTIYLPSLDEPRRGAAAHVG